MDCCQCQGIEIQFDAKKAQKKLRKYRASGLQKTTQILVDAIKKESIQGRTLLDVGGGIGAIQHDLLRAGMRSATNLEASQAYIDACKEEAVRQGHADRIAHMHADFAQIDTVPAEDVVTMERVICCYDDYEELVSHACSKSKSLLGVVYPHEAWWVRLGMGVIYNLKFKLTGNPFRVFLHPSDHIDEIIQENGFKNIFYEISGAWQIILYRRANPAS